MGKKGQKYRKDYDELIEKVINEYQNNEGTYVSLAKKCRRNSRNIVAKKYFFVINLYNKCNYKKIEYSKKINYNNFI